MRALQGERGFVTFDFTREQVVVVLGAVRVLYGRALRAAPIFVLESEKWRKRRIFVGF